MPAVIGNYAHAETGSGVEPRTGQGEETNEEYAMRESGSPAEQATGEGWRRGVTIREEVQLNLEGWVDHAQRAHIMATKGDMIEHVEGNIEGVEEDDAMSADIDTFMRSPPVTVQVCRNWVLEERVGFSIMLGSVRDSFFSK